MSTDNWPEGDDRIRRRTRRQRIGAVLTVLIFGVGMFSQCAARHPGEVAGSPLINTSSVLFPQHTMTEDAIGEQQELFVTGLDEMAPVTKTVAKVTEVRSGPSELHEVLDILAPGDEIVVDGQVAHWYRIAGDSKFVSGQALTDEDGVAWATTVTNSGDSAAVNACTGGLTEFTAMSDDLGVPAYAIHSYCGGEPILKLQLGDVVSIDSQHYRVASVSDFPLFSSTEVMHDLTADAFMQTCDLAKGTSRVLGLEKV